MQLKDRDFKWAVAHNNTIYFIKKFKLTKKDDGSYTLDDITLSSYFNNEDTYQVSFSSRVAKYIEDCLRESDEFKELGENPTLFTVPDQIYMLNNWDDFLEQQGLGKVKIGHLATFGGLTVKVIDQQLEAERQEEIKAGTPPLKTHPETLKKPYSSVSSEDIDKVFEEAGLDPKKDVEVNTTLNTSLNTGSLDELKHITGFVTKPYNNRTIIPKSLPKEP